MLDASDSWHPHLINLMMDWSNSYGSSAIVFSLYIFLSFTHTCTRTHTLVSITPLDFVVQESESVLSFSHKGAGYSTVFTSWVLLPSHLVLAHVCHSAETFTTPVLELVLGLGGTSGLLGEVLVGGVGMLMIAVVTWLLLLQFRPPDSSGIMLRLDRL